MATGITTKKRAPRKSAKRRSAPTLSNAQLLKLAQKNRPPQSWFDEQSDPTQPQRR
jgi:hypothetical protein